MINTTVSPPLITDSPVQVQMGLAMLAFTISILIVLAMAIVLFGQRVITRLVDGVKWFSQALYVCCCLKACTCCSGESWYNRLISRGEDLTADEVPLHERDFIAEINNI